MSPQPNIFANQISFPMGSVAPPLYGKKRLPRVLTIDWEASLLEAHAKALTAIGCLVRSALPLEVSKLVISDSYRAAVFGHTLLDAETAELAVHARVANPRTKLVLLVGLDPRPRFIEALFDALVLTSDGPEALTRSVSKLLAGA